MKMKFLKTKAAISAVMLSVVIFQFLIPVQVSAATVTVTSESELSGAISSAAWGDTITINNDITLTGALPEINKDLTIVTSTSGAKLTMTDAAAGKRHFRVLNGASVTFSNLTLDGNSKGGGIESNGNIIVKDTDITNCNAISGAAIFSTGALTIENSNIYNNVSTSYGGGVYAQSNTEGNNITVTQTDFNGNKTARGAGLYVSGKSEINITDSTFSGNTAKESGGGIFADAVITVKSSIIEKNTANIGGGMFLIPAESTTGLLDAEIQNSIFKNNKAVDSDIVKGSGGALSASAYNLVITGGEFTENESESTGGAVSIGTGKLTVNAGTKIENNKAKIAGGGIYSEFIKYGNLDLTKSSVMIEGSKDDPIIIKNNTSDQNGGGIYLNENSILNLKGFVQISGNKAVKGNGGGIWTDKLQNVTAQKDVTFTDNLAKEFTLIFDEDIPVHKEHILVAPAVFSKHDGKTLDYAYNNYDINYKEGNEVPKTGDTTDTIGLFILMLAAVGTILCLAMFKKKQNREVR